MSWPGVCSLTPWRRRQCGLVTYVRPRLSRAAAPGCERLPERQCHRCQHHHNHHQLQLPGVAVTAVHHHCPPIATRLQQQQKVTLAIAWWGCWWRCSPPFPSPSVLPALCGMAPLVLLSCLLGACTLSRLSWAMMMATCFTGGFVTAEANQHDKDNAETGVLNSSTIVPAQILIFPTTIQPALHHVWRRLPRASRPRSWWRWARTQCYTSSVDDEWQCYASNNKVHSNTLDCSKWRWRDYHQDCLAAQLAASH